jgi:hypothetical protein
MKVGENWLMLGSAGPRFIRMTTNHLPSNGCYRKFSGTPLRWLFSRLPVWGVGEMEPPVIESLWRAGEVGVGDAKDILTVLYVY